MKPYITISLTSACNLRCVYCPPQGENYNTPAMAFSLEGLRQVLDVARALGVTKVRFTGGEPFLYRRLRSAVEYASGLGLEVHINTNGLLLGQHLGWLSGIPHVVVKVSLDAMTDSLMSRIAGSSHVETIVGGIKQGAEMGIVQRVNVVLTRLNMFEIPGLVSLCGSLSIGLKIFDMFFVPETRAAWDDLYVPPKALPLQGVPAAPYDYTSMYGIPTDELFVKGVPVRIKDSANGSHYHRVCVSCPSFPCQEGLYCLVVTPSMTVIPCRLGLHLFHRCSSPEELAEAIGGIIRLYEESHYENAFWPQRAALYDTALQRARSWCESPNSLQVDPRPEGR